MFDIAQHRDEILKRWIDLVVDGYPEETAKFLRSKSDQFANPVGAGLHEGLADLLDGLINGVDAVDLGPALDRVIRVRAVQEFAPSEAVKFVFDLKDLLFDIAGDEDRDPVADEIASRIEAAGLYELPRRDVVDSDARSPQSIDWNHGACGGVERASRGETGGRAAELMRCGSWPNGAERKEGSDAWER